MKLLSLLLHYANRTTKEQSFYSIKDKILKKYGVFDGYDIQHIPGKRCYSCGGTGKHWFYSNTYPYKAYDYSDCWHCHGGWFKFPQWICLERKTFGGYTFHRPIKRELMVKNPFIESEIGWQVSQRKVIEGYIEHESHSLGKLSVLIIYLIYNRKAMREFWKKEIHIKWWLLRPYYRLKWKIESRKRLKQYEQTGLFLCI